MLLLEGSEMRPRSLSLRERLTSSWSKRVDPACCLHMEVEESSYEDRSESAAGSHSSFHRRPPGNPEWDKTGLCGTTSRVRLACSSSHHFRVWGESLEEGDTLRCEHLLSCSCSSSVFTLSRFSTSRFLSSFFFLLRESAGSTRKDFQKISVVS